MEWLNDKKNQPIVIGVLVGIIAIVGFCIWFFGIRKPAPPVDTTAQTQPMAPAADGSQPAQPGADASGAPAGPAGAPGGAAVGQPGATGQTPPAGGSATAPAGAAPAGAVQVASVKPMETWRPDPFQPIGYKPPKQVRVTPPIRDFPFEQMFAHRRRGSSGNAPKAEIQQPSRRMAGILLGDRVYAILETNGATQVVQPGDYTTDRLAIVQRIEPDKIVLKTVDEKPRYVTVRMAASPVVQSASSAPAPSGPAPGNYGPPGVGGPPPPPPGMGAAP